MNESSDTGEPKGQRNSDSPGVKTAAKARLPLPGVAFRPDREDRGQWLNGWRVADETQCVCR